MRYQRSDALDEIFPRGTKTQPRLSFFMGSVSRGTKLALFHETMRGLENHRSGDKRYDRFDAQF